MKRHEANFDKDLPAGYDGHFEWDVFKENACWGDSKIEPMDFDAVVERKRNYLVFETKDEGKDVPQGQQITLDNLKNAKTFTVAKIWPKVPPFETMEMAHQSGKTETIKGHKAIIDKIRRWYWWADGRDPTKVCPSCGLGEITKDGKCDLCVTVAPAWEDFDASKAQ